jgi:2-phosphosulfolactate phosphatase
MEIKYATLETCSTAAGAIVAIDVIRAFTTAAYAFAAGASRIILADTTNEALALRQQIPGALVMGELGGLPVTGFDFGNSPSELAEADLTGRWLIQRTSAGTQGIIRSVQANLLLGASFVCAGATARYLKRQSLDNVTFVVTGIIYDRDGDEDLACADYMTALLRGQHPDTPPYLQRVRQSTSGQLFADPHHPEFPAADLERCAELDRFNFALVVERRDGLLVMQAVE